MYYAASGFDSFADFLRDDFFAAAFLATFLTARLDFAQRSLCVSAIFSLASGLRVRLVRAVNPLTNKIYVANQTGKSVSVIDGSNDTVTATVPLGAGASPFAVVVNTATNVVYAVNNGANTVTVINGNDNTIIGSPLALGANTNLVAAAVNPVNNTIYVANNGNTNNPANTPGNVSLIASATVNGSITPASIITTVGTGVCGSGIRAAIRARDRH